MNYPRSFQNLVDCFKRLPGIGGKSAERLAYYILSMDIFLKLWQLFTRIFTIVKNVDIFVRMKYVIFVWMKIVIKVLSV